ncbi:uncharacterized protein J4E79_005356 [Alternaria viburni]|uniref:uncharacterized protein n=1 Tax=Alternaria viburni TaxID=566460 RepID=UPI0020C298DD|nr:uncharacterized protein J4E79_005356 [Alternaria viburni]KAI4660788.1 hypothetical protein J4E79_005356 [Alternaria viburni]
MTQAVSKQDTSSQQVQQQRQGAGSREVQEHHASANASAGLNLNLFGALSGAFSSKQKKTTHQNADGSSTTEEDKHDKGSASAAVGGRGSAYAAGNAQQSSLKAKESGMAQEQKQGKKVEKVDHLGIEG